MATASEAGDERPIARPLNAGRRAPILSVPATMPEERRLAVAWALTAKMPGSCAPGPSLAGHGTKRAAGGARGAGLGLACAKVGALGQPACLAAKKSRVGSPLVATRDAPGLAK